MAGIRLNFHFFLTFVVFPNISHFTHHVVLEYLFRCQEPEPVLNSGCNVHKRVNPKSKVAFGTQSRSRTTFLWQNFWYFNLKIPPKPVKSTKGVLDDRLVQGDEPAADGGARVRALARPLPLGRQRRPHGAILPRLGAQPQAAPGETCDVITLQYSTRRMYRVFVSNMD